MSSQQNVFETVSGSRIVTKLGCCIYEINNIIDSVEEVPRISQFMIWTAMNYITSMSLIYVNKTLIFPYKLNILIYWSVVLLERLMSNFIV